MITEDTTDDLQRFETPDEAFQYIRYVGTQENAEIDLAEASIALALIFLPGLHIDRYRQHFKKLSDHVREEYESRLRLQHTDNLEMRINVLRKIIHEAHGYKGDDLTYDDIQNVNIIRVIERRKGLPIAIGIIYMVLARSMGWQIDGLNFPGHFLIRMEMGAERMILDPFRQGQLMQASDLRVLIKSIVGQKAELSHNYYDAVSSRDILIRLQNNLKKRLIEQEEYAQAILVVEAMEALAPDEYRTLFDKGVLYAKLGQKPQAADAFRLYIAKTPHAAEKQQGRDLLQQILSSP